MEHLQFSEAPFLLLLLATHQSSQGVDQLRQTMWPDFYPKSRSLMKRKNMSRGLRLRWISTRPPDSSVLSYHVSRLRSVQPLHITNDSLHSFGRTMHGRKWKGSIVSKCTCNCHPRLLLNFEIYYHLTGTYLTYKPVLGNRMSKIHRYPYSRY